MWFIHPSANGHQSAQGFRCQGAARTGKEGSLMEDTDLRNKRWDPWGVFCDVLLQPAKIWIYCQFNVFQSIESKNIKHVRYQTWSICREFDTFGTALSEETIRSIYYCEFLVPCCTSIRLGIIWMFSSRKKYYKNSLKQYKTVMNIIPP